jgi:hypothetical protein
MLKWNPTEALKMKTRFDLLYDVAARLGNADVINAELVLEQLREAGAVTFDDHTGYGLSEDADLLAAYKAALRMRIADLHEKYREALPHWQASGTAREPGLRQR